MEISKLSYRPAFENNVIGNNENFNPFLLTDIGPIKQMNTPEGWKHTHEIGLMGLGTRRREQYTPVVDESVSLVVFNRGVPISDQAAKFFLEILRTKPATNRAHVLIAKEIRALSEVLNRATVGDNQFSNAKGIVPATFNLRSAQNIRLNGRTVMEVEGSFLDRMGKRIKDFRGIYADDGCGGNRIQQVFLQTNPELFPKYLRDYKAAINSIFWKD